MSNYKSNNCDTQNYDPGSECPKPPPPPPTPPPVTNDDDFQSVMKMLEVNKCETAQGFAIDLLPPIAGGISLSSGCESINIIKSSYKASMDVIQCSISKMSNCSKVTIESGSEVKIINHGEIKGDINITQKGNIKVVQLTQFTNAVRNNLSSKIVTTIKNMIEQFQKSDKGYLATQSAQKQLSDISSEINSQVFQASISTSINDIASEINNDKHVVIVNYGTIDKNISINQEDYINLVSSSITSNVFENILKSSNFSSFFNDLKQKEESKDEGIPSFAFGGIILVIILAIGAFIYFGGSTVENVIKYIVPIALISLIIATVIFSITKSTVNAIICGIASGAILFYQIYMIFGEKAYSSNKLSKLKKFKA
jgi:hypothetical protein